MERLARFAASVALVWVAATVLITRARIRVYRSLTRAGIACAVTSRRRLARARRDLVRRPV
jgi:hypothetical protein